MASKVKRAPLDVETGGTIIGHHSLLTLYICVLSDEGQVMDDLDLKIKPDDGNVIWEQEALDVNGIDLEEHLADPNTVTYSVARRLFLEWAKRNLSGKRTLRPAGHNIAAFDLPMIMAHLKIGQDEWDEIFHYGLLDTMPLMQAFKDAGWLPDEVGSQDSLVKYYGVPQLKSHVAKNDTLMWVGVYLAMVRSLVERKNGGAGTDELLILE
jgi:hypothetical protein